MPCLSPHVFWFLPNGTPPVGWLQSALSTLVGEEWGAGFPRARSRGRSRGVGVGSSILGQAFRLERLLGDGWCLKRVLRSERWAKEVDERAPVLKGRPSGRRPDFSSGLLCFSFLGRPMKYMLFLLGRAGAWKPVLEGPWVYEPDRSPRAPGRFG